MPGSMGSLRGMGHKAHSAAKCTKNHFHRKDYWKEDEPCERAFHVTCKALRLCEF